MIDDPRILGNDVRFVFCVVNRPVCQLLPNLHFFPEEPLARRRGCAGCDLVFRRSRLGD